MTVCPALLPPWLRTTTWAREVSTSMILPLPSSPHCIPIKIVFAMEIRNGQKISQHLLARCWACLQIIGWPDQRATNFAGCVALTLALECPPVEEAVSFSYNYP